MMAKASQNERIAALATFFMGTVGSGYRSLVREGLLSERVAWGQLQKPSQEVLARLEIFLADGQNEMKTSHTRAANRGIRRGMNSWQRWSIQSRREHLT